MKCVSWSVKLSSMWCYRVYRSRYRPNKERTARYPAFTVCAAVINQLLYIKSVFEGVEKDKSDFISFPSVPLQPRNSNRQMTSWRES
ncbi:hypothetical protein ALP74_200114 [Pseudomonas coronafaciens pv. garcae]|uniref:Uncharacterized protein n=1 Tax=Pseudomonas coronafaciens pv. garcae TaxID=251653 RepID=A0AB37QNJ8_9PSED|nr:hypothetical protein ALP74_200114 [Pseudomonas coronafaciens pv. garcae]